MRKILVALLAIALMVLAVACMAPEEEAGPIGEAPVAEPVVPIEPVTVPVAELELLADVVCANQIISAVITNNGEEAWTLNDDIKVILNGGWDKEPGCDKETIEPGENMACNAIDFPIVQIPGKKNVLVVVADGSRATVEVYCQEAAAAEE
ncbi:hypothetical protein KY306_00160 [Candidatus Woesearchaeota archaeon]|nr:hypothetical protein [Candidatus Woesearchaeota archaeon]